MRQTIYRHKVGTTEHRATAYYIVPLDDPNALGNMGLEGFDDDSESKELPTQAKAVAWLRSIVKKHPDRLWQNARIDRLEYAEDSWEHRGELILDAEERHTHTRYYFISEGRVGFESEYEERGW